MQDAAQKDMLYRHFRAQGWYALVEVPVYNTRGQEAKPRLVTDVDVLAIRPSADLSWDVLLGDCKTKKGESPANRVLWVRGLMAHFHASRAVVLLRQPKGIERDHALFGESHSVTLLEESIFQSYDRCVVFPGGSSTFPEPADVLRSIRFGVPAQYGGLKPLADYINGQAWNHSDQMAIVRRALGAGLSVRRELDPSKPNQLAFAVEAAGTFGIGLAACVGVIFHQYLRTDDRDALDSGLKVLIWAGRENYDHVASLRRQLLEAKGVQGSEATLALPEWPAFIHLVRSFLAAPKLAFETPQLLRSVAFDIMLGRPSLRSYGPADLMLIKLAMNTALYYFTACGFPSDGVSAVRARFHQRMADLTAGPEATAPPIVVAEPTAVYASATGPTAADSSVPATPPTPTPEPAKAPKKVRKGRASKTKPKRAASEGAQQSLPVPASDEAPSGE